MNTTLDFYENNADIFAVGTQDVVFADVQERFLSFLPAGGRILDFGCGAGRDTRYFLSKGYVVDATDGSAELCRIAGRNTGINVRQMLFSQLDEDCVYDGIWACASVLHLPKSELKDVFVKMIRAVKPGGYIYASFKYGEFEGERNGRYFTDFTDETFRIFANDLSDITIIEEWISDDVRPGRGDEKWLNVMIRRS